MSNSPFFCSSEVEGGVKCSGKAPRLKRASNICSSEVEEGVKCSGKGGEYLHFLVLVLPRELVQDASGAQPPVNLRRDVRLFK